MATHFVVLQDLPSAGTWTHLMPGEHSGRENRPSREQILRSGRAAYDAMAAAGSPLCRPAKDSELADPLRTVDAAGWLGKSIAGRRVLCLAAGGGRQSSLYAAAGAEVTVVDLSGAMLELDRRVAAERGYSLRLFETSMDDLRPLRDAEFDIVIHPVSTCYLPSTQGVFEEVARVTAPGGLYVSQHKTPTSLQATTSRGDSGHFELWHGYYDDHAVADPDVNCKAAGRLRERGAMEFVHRWEAIVGGICRSGFVIEDLVEPVHADPRAARDTFADRANFIAPYVRIKARRASNPSGGAPVQTPVPKSRLWIPS